tara:strand:- start:780 stop:1811 length:1032 start_codon:yes stop_codon:yes gene_type:complete
VDYEEFFGMNVGPHIHTVMPDDVDLRLDRWFKQKFPNISQGKLQKWLRTGQIRIDGRRIKANHRLSKGQKVRVPPFVGSMPPLKEHSMPKKKDDKSSLGKLLAESVLYIDDEVLAISKPPGIPVQGGTKASKHIDGALDSLKFGNLERPRLVHRLDKDTSGVLLLARTRQAARWLSQAFRERVTDKTYWALVVGDLRPFKGTVDLPVAKLPGKYGERMVIDETLGQRAITDYAVIEQLGKKASWIAMRPRTGRTHQLRVHMAALGTPILGDGKYGGEQAFLDYNGLSRKMHLHARDIRLKRVDRSEIFIDSDLPVHMKKSWKLLGLDTGNYRDPFEVFKAGET